MNSDVVVAEFDLKDSLLFSCRTTDEGRLTKLVRFWTRLINMQFSILTKYVYGCAFETFIGKLGVYLHDQTVIHVCTQRQERAITVVSNSTKSIIL